MPDDAASNLRALCVDDVDIELLVLARNDAAPESTWYFDPTTGESLYFGLDDDTDLDALRDGQHVVIPCDPQPAADVDDFLDLVDDEQAVELYRCFHRRRGWKRFRDAVVRLGLQERWQTFTMTRESVRAIDWLRSRGLVVEPEATERRDQLAQHCGLPTT